MVIRENISGVCCFIIRENILTTGQIQVIVSDSPPAI